jgi:hypothetical protein
MPMQPNPRAETSSPPEPRMRFSMSFLRVRFDH